ncbi:hypothetical protein BOTCAL_0273g00130 [Botryotinia calthae]|uniref:Uncharacterized protein n=1 Tax=Botryotinia calthae TaxID=38488 RepID=A0A4Y8CY88_9HELO|nr:hypothetical protein BOTCAL_0273g00130 [Botryotinia calthae]
MDPTQLFFPYKKSALTPHALDNPRLKVERKNHQKWIFSGYWPELLEEIGAYPYPLNYLPVLNNPIEGYEHWGKFSSPLFELDQWQPRHTLETWLVIQMEFPPHKPFFPVEPDNTGLWTADNPAVWRRLDPILRLCTRFLHHPAATCWIVRMFLNAWKFGKTLYILRAINFVLAQQVKPDKNETYEDVIDRVGTAMDYGGLERLQSSDVQNEILQSASQETITAQAMIAYQRRDFDVCHRLGRVLLSQFGLEGYVQGTEMVLIAMHPREIRRRWCARQGLHVLNIMVKSNANSLLELWVEVATQVHDAIEDLAVNTGIGDALCVLGLD